jgi:hypothetical protein
VGVTNNDEGSRSSEYDTTVVRGRTRRRSQTRSSRSMGQSLMFTQSDEPRARFGETDTWVRVCLYYAALAVNSE